MSLKQPNLLGFTTGEMKSSTGHAWGLSDSTSRLSRNRTGIGNFLLDRIR